MKYHKEKYKILCKNCLKGFEVIYARKDIAKYCSVSCQKIGQKQNIGPNKGRHFNNRARKNMRDAALERFKHEEIWNKGLKMGRNPKISNENHYLWKGDKANYISLHQWVRRNLGQPKKCAICGEDKKKLAWASISHQAKRNLNDYMAFCYKCHNQYDDIAKRAWITKKKTN